MQVSQLYVALFGRASEGAGNKFWQGAEDMQSAAQGMVETDAAEEFYGDKYDDDAAFVEMLYLNTMNKAPDAEGLDHWVASLEGGASRGEVAAEFIAAIEDNKEIDPVGYATFNNRVAVSDYTADKVPGEDLKVSELDEFVGYVSEVTDDESTVAAAKEKVDADVPDPGVPGETITLTTGTDIVGPEVEDADFRTTENNDTIKAVSSSLSSARTLDAADQIDGGKGNNTLEVDMQGSFTGFTGDGFMKNVQTVTLANDGTIARTFSAKQVEGVEAYNLTGAINLSDLGSTDAAVNLADRASGTTTIAYASKVTDGTDDALALGLTNIGTVAVKNAAGTVTTPEAAVTVTAAGIEEINITATGVNIVALGANNAKALTAAGDGSLKLTDVGSGLKTLDASGLKGDLDVNLSSATGVTSVLAGAGDDIIRAGANDLAINAEINGGAGNNTLALSGAINTVQYQMAGVQTIEIAAVTGMTFSAVNTTGVESLVVKGAANNAVFANMGTIDLGVTLVRAASGSVGSDNSGSTTLNVSGGTKATPTTALVNTSFSKASSVELNVAQYNTLGDGTNGNITATAAQSFTANLAGAVDNTITLAAATSAVFIDTNITTDNTVALVATKLTDLVVTNAGDFTLTGSNLSSLETLTVNASKHFDGTNIALAKISSIELAGSGDAAQVTLDDLGSTTLDYGISVNAEGLAAGLDIGTIDTAAAGTISVNVAGVLGDVGIGNITVANTGAGALTGSITIDANGTAGDIELGALHAKVVTVDASGALGTVTGTGGLTNTVDITAETATFNGSALGVNEVVVNASKSATITGGIDDDLITVGNSVAGTKAVFTVTTGLGDDVIAIGTVNGALRLTITDFSVGDANIATASFTGTDFSTTGAAEVATFLTSALGTAVAAEAVSEAYTGSYAEGIFVYGNTVHAATDSATTGTYDDGDVLITFTGVTAADVTAAADLIS
ncbi:DUF4214 domain-containing protein [Desulfobotulus mexicanus]|uniref:DUF4214 domain-containing protein n=1 Tax=Desulfobotulus mexicanus TaxID=2586642 RepID=A0A5S5MCW9_9BACT|nr:DUF4214 domain-containing protein [Desulfobotulus mexicanus]TYT73489.1 DUF4214 domain-containing protein [Desulfobotulus mexicanus]